MNCLEITMRKMNTYKNLADTVFPKCDTSKAQGFDLCKF